MPGTHCYMPPYKNRSNVNVINDHFRAKTAAIHKRQTRFALRHHQDTSSNKNQIFVFLPDTLAVRLLSSSLSFSFCKLQLSYLHIYFIALCVTIHVVKNWCIKCCHWWRILHGSSLRLSVHDLLLCRCTWTCKLSVLCLHYWSQTISFYNVSTHNMLSYK